MIYQNQETQSGHHATAISFLHVHQRGSFHKQANFQTCRLYHMKINFPNSYTYRRNNLNFNIEFQRSYHTLSAVIRLFSGLETSDLIESRSVRGTPYSLSIVSTRRLLQYLYTLGAVACPVNPMVSRYLLNDSMF